jgi:hypothetical protein
MTLYRIANWSEYETHETRKLERLFWIKVPNKHDGLGFRHVAAERDPCALYAAWILMVQLASKSGRSDRGKLVREGTPLDSRAMSLMTGFPQKAFDRALVFFSQPHIGWLLAEASAVISRPPGESGGAPGESPGRMEGNGMDGKEGKGRAAGAELVVFPENLQGEQFQSAWTAWLAHRSEIKHPLKPTQAKAVIEQLSRKGSARAILAIRWTIFKGWQGLREPDATEAREFQQQPDQRSILPEPTRWQARMKEHFADSTYVRNGDVDRPWAMLSRDQQQTLTEVLKKTP